MQDHKPRPRFLERKTPQWVEWLIALTCGALIGIALFY